MRIEIIETNNVQHDRSSLLARREWLEKALPAIAISAASPALAGFRSDTKPPIKIGQIGVGHGHASKLSVYRDSPDYEVVGWVEPDVSLRRAAEGNPVFQGIPWLTREQLLATPGLQAVLVETRVCDLLDNAETCIDAGVHVHLDKPAGESLPHFRRILNSADRKNLLVQMGYMYRYNPAVVLLRDFLNRGWLGEIFEVHAVMSKVVDPASRRDLARYPGGILFELGGHIMDLVIAILGAPQAVTSFNRHSGSIGDGLLDNMLCVLEYPKATATLKSSAIEVEGNGRRHLVVCGTEGTFHIQPLDNPSARVSLSRDCGEYKKGTQEITFPRYTRYVGDAMDMAQIIRGEKASDYPTGHDFTVQETLLRACGQRTD